MHPSGIVLARTYPFDEQTESKAQNWGELLWKQLRALLAVGPPTTLRSHEQYHFLSDRLTNYVHTRLVVRGTQLAKEYTGLPADRFESELDRLVEDLLDVTPNDRAKIVWLLVKICPRVAANGASLSAAQLKTIRRFASENSHRCYMCGHSLIHDNEADDELVDFPDDAPDEVKHPLNYWSFEVEHLFPQKRGGGRGRENLAAACKSCNKFKDVFITFADLPVETYVTPSHKPENVKSAFGGVRKFALLWRQRGCCARCEIPFFDAPDERLVLLRKDRNDAYHFFNVDIACGACGEQEEEGIMLRA